MNNVEIEFNKNNRNYYLSFDIIKKIDNLYHEILPDIIKKSFNCNSEDIEMGNIKIYSLKADEDLSCIDINKCINMMMCRFYFCVSDITRNAVIDICPYSDIISNKEEIIKDLSKIARPLIELRDANKIIFENTSRMIDENINNTIELDLD